MLRQDRPVYVFAVVTVVFAAVGGWIAFASAQDILGRDSPPSRLEVVNERPDELLIGFGEAAAIAHEHGSGVIREIEIEWDGERLIYEIQIGTTIMLLDATHGALIAIIDYDEVASRGAAIDIEPVEPEITMQQAVAAAQAEVDGAVLEIEMSVDEDGPIYRIDIGHQKVIVDATSGLVLAVMIDD